MGEGQVRAVWCCFAFLYNPLIRSFQRLCVCECVLVASICEWLRSTTKSEWADYAAVQAECGNLSGTSSHATRQTTLSHIRLSSLRHYGLILAEGVELVSGS